MELWTKIPGKIAVSLERLSPQKYLRLSQRTMGGSTHEVARQRKHE